MLSDRSYMRDAYPRRTTSVLVWSICAIVAGFVVQSVFLHWFGAGEFVTRFLALTVPNVQAGRLWTLLTHGLLHSTQNLLHVVGVLLGLYFLGRELLPLLGPRRFLGVFWLAVAAGGGAWALTHAFGGGGSHVMLGAVAGVAALLVVFACFFPNQQMTFLLFFILPVTLKPKYVAFAALTIDLCGFLFYEVMGAVSPFDFAHSAHLGGMAVGWIYYRYVHESSWGLFSRRPDIELPRWMKKSKKVAVAESPAYSVDITNRTDLRAEVDRILDKINSDGFASLTPDEKRLLDSAKDLLSRR